MPRGKVSFVCLARRELCREVGGRNAGPKGDKHGKATEGAFKVVQNSPGVLQSLFRKPRLVMSGKVILKVTKGEKVLHVRKKEEVEMGRPGRKGEILLL